MKSLQTTVKDVMKITDKSVNVVKGAMYYAFIPAILYLGIKTVDWNQFSPQNA
jgi:ABC-type arginine transport system permease subunit